MKWHHSLYWRIAIGFVACLALLLMVQAVLFVWMLARSGRTIPNQPPDRLAQTIAVDASTALERDPGLDLANYIREEYARDAQPFFVLLADGTTIDIGGPFEPSIVEESKARLAVMRRADPERLGRGRGFGLRPPLGPPPAFDRAPGDRPEGPAGLGPQRGPAPDPFRPGPGEGRGGRGRGFGPLRPAPIVAARQLVGVVVVPPQPPFGFLLARYAPVLGLVALATLIVGALLATVVIFGPARARLREVENAARRLGAGDLSARAPERGRDEVSAVAAAFNAMAVDLAARAEALQASDRTRRQLLADVSHELNTPMTAIRGYLETLSMPDMTLDADTRSRYLRIVGDETGRLERVIGDLLDLARLEGGGMALSIDDVSVESLLARVVARHERVAAAANVGLTVEIAPDAVSVRGDRDRLEQALQNLTANALRYAPDGSSVRLAARAVEGGTGFSVTNAGPAIAPEHLPHIFDRFYRAESSRARGGNSGASGTGLGLSIVKAIVERHGGTISVTRSANETSFSLVIPTTSVSAPAEAWT